jgi:transposase
VISGIGPPAATALIAAIDNGAAFHQGRDFAAGLGLVPRAHSTGGEQKLLGISKGGSRSLRTLFVHDVRSVWRVKETPASGLSTWWTQFAGELITRLPP